MTQTANREYSYVLPTQHNGITYRSRLEAKWAVFYSTLNIQFQYEPDGYNLGGIWYLPDFFLPKQQCFIEIKPTYPTDAEETKLSQLSIFTQKRCFLFFGGVSIPFEYPDTDDAAAYFPTGGCDYGYSWCECPQCGFFDIQFGGRSARCICSCEKIGDRSSNYDSEKLLNAYEVARTYQFTK